MPSATLGALCPLHAVLDVSIHRQCNCRPRWSSFLQYTTGTTTQGGPDEVLGLGKLSDLSKPLSLL